MWRKFLIRDDLTFGTAFAVQGVKLGAFDRAPMSLSDRAAELAATAKLFADPREREAFRERAFKTMWRDLEDARRAAAHSLTEMTQSLASSRIELQDLYGQQQALIQERDALNAERTALVTEAQLVARQHEAVVRTLVAQHDAAREALQAVLTSTSWYVTKPLRWLRRRLEPHVALSCIFAHSHRAESLPP